MTTRRKRLTALMLVLLTLLNAGSALAAEEFWKWGDEYEEKLILSQPTEVTDLQVFKDELYFIYGDLLLKCHEPDDTPETLQRRVMEQAEWKLLPQAAEMISEQIGKEQDNA